MGIEDFGHTADEGKEGFAETANELKRRLESGEVLSADDFYKLMQHNYGWLAVRFPDGFEGVPEEEMDALRKSQREKE